jgi:hypothetical protein
MIFPDSPSEVAVPEPQLFEAPADLTLEDVARLTSLEAEAVAEFDRVMGLEQHTAADITYAERLTSDLDRIKAELRVRATREAEAATLAQQEQSRRMAALSERVHGEGNSSTAAAAAPGSVVDLTELTQATARGVALALFGDDEAKLASAQKRFASLGETAARAPRPVVQERVPNAVTASIDIPGVAHGTEMTDLAALAEAFQRKAKAIPVTRDGRSAARHQVASIRNTFAHTIDDRTTEAKVEELWKELTKAENQQALVAGGGWCAPSQLMYDFFNIAEETDGAIDLPTVGVSRGGIRFPVSPAIGDVFFQNAGSNPASGFGGFAFTMSNATDPWLWTESDDQATVTGSVNKPTLRVPCPSFSEVRLECYGISLTAGNLTDDAYPESTANFIRLLRAAYSHAINARLISLMDTAAGGATTVGAVTTDGPATRVLNAIGLAAMDYRARYAMGTRAVLEVVVPYWMKEIIRADLVLRPYSDPSLLAVADAQIDSYFSARNVRVQWVNDYQVRGSNQPGSSSNLTVWPATVNFLVYAAGTFLHGTGLQLDLGVIRDSVLNAENDYTAVWAEECHLIAQVGHAARKYTCAFAVSGQVGGAVATPNGAHV